MATFEKRGTRWRAQVRRQGVAESKTFATKAQAKSWAIDRERELASVAAGGLPNKTIRQALERYRDEDSPRKRGAVWEIRRINSWLGRHNNVTGRPSDQMLPWLNKPLADLSADDLTAWRKSRETKLAPASILREMNLMGVILEAARRDWAWLHINPIKTVRRPPTPPHRTRRVSQADIDALCISLAWDESGVLTQTQEVAAAFLLAIETAMRQGEILGLSWADVDMTRRVAHLALTKNGSSRDVPLSSRALEILRLMRGRDPDRVFTLTSANCDVLFRRGRDRAAVEDLHFHDSRREATSRLSKKVDVLTLARITGHKDIKMLLVYYQTDMADVAMQIG